MVEPASEGLRVAAFTALREEISRRSNAQLQLVSISLVGFTTFAGFVLGYHARPELLLLVPLLSTVTGLLWLDHHRRIKEIGEYIRYEIFSGAKGSFEERADQSTLTTRVLEFLFPTMAVFIVPAVAALIWACHRGVEWRTSVLWWVGAVMTGLYCLYFICVSFAPAQYIVILPAKSGYPNSRLRRSFSQLTRYVRSQTFRFCNRFREQGGKKN